MSLDAKRLNRLYERGWYDYLCSDEFEEVYRHISSQFISHKAKNILDIGCWNGMFYRALDRMGYDHNYFGFDLCSSAIKDAKKWHQNERVRFSTYDWNGEPIEGEFDALYFGGVLYYIEDKLSFVNKYIQNYKPDIVIIQDLQQTDLSCFDEEYTTKTKTFNIDIAVNEARRKRQVKVFETKLGGQNEYESTTI